MDVQQKLDEIVAAVEGAKGMPMSASCVINRAELLTSLEQVRQALPGSLAQAREVLGGREQVVAEAQQEAQRIVEAARAERGSLVDGTEVARQAQAEADRLLGEARREAAEVKVEADDYVDSKLANFEVVLGKTIGSVDRGREKLLGPGREDSQELLERADAYVDAQFSAIEAVLRKTLDAVGRGRRKLTGYRPIDELAEHVVAQDALGETPDGQPQEFFYGTPATTHEDYGFGAHVTTAPQEYGQREVVPDYAQGYQQQAPVAQDGYGQSAYGGQDPYGYAQPPQLPDSPLPGALEETSLFDTGMIDAEQLRRYEQGHGY